MSRPCIETNWSAWPVVTSQSSTLVSRFACVSEKLLQGVPQAKHAQRATVGFAGKLGALGATETEMVEAREEAPGDRKGSSTPGTRLNHFSELHLNPNTCVNIYSQASPL